MHLFFIILTVFTSNNTKENLLDSFAGQFRSIQPVPDNAIEEKNLSSQLGNSAGVLHEKYSKPASKEIEKETHIYDATNLEFQTEKIIRDYRFSNIESLSKEKFMNIDSGDKGFYGFYVPTECDKTTYGSLEGFQGSNAFKFDTKNQNGSNQTNFSHNVGNFDFFPSDHLNAIEKKNYSNLENSQQQKNKAIGEDHTNLYPSTITLPVDDFSHSPFPNREIDNFQKKGIIDIQNEVPSTNKTLFSENFSSLRSSPTNQFDTDKDACVISGKMVDGRKRKCEKTTDKPFNFSIEDIIGPKKNVIVYQKAIDLMLVSQ
ncbi:hypothetical protein EDEG_02717 [Edhazardia aedis USNM 41457]|uniref:Uncharacterized protein n=1 Tax=Edhazardia aedis (strain USNM 41457) TaxID=1003232 RepID=J8ZT91_EDHAE|nr:hypothetical protein EDEG_02717 [Edhazardia aedis USNM 41457]|eukprot:EJW02893.1 hypothetical protein EDEG_02717 [Edhazardia aedis USNM 41457]